MTARRLGYLPDHHDPRDFPFGISVSPSYSTLRASVVSVLDQGDTESCVANAIVQAVSVQQRAKGIIYPQLSRLSIYWHARAEQGLPTAAVDSGCHIRDAVKALQQLGAPDELTWPFDPRWVNKRPSWLAEREGFDRRGVRGYMRISGIDGIRSAIASGRPVVGGWQVDQAFQDINGPALVTSFGAPIGGHCMCIIGYDSDTFEIVNSWGSVWRGGFVRFSNDLAAQANDLWAIDLAS